MQTLQCHYLTTPIPVAGGELWADQGVSKHDFLSISIHCPVQQVLCLCPPRGEAQSWSRTGRYGALQLYFVPWLTLPGPPSPQGARRCSCTSSLPRLGIRDRERKRSPSEAMHLLWLTSTILIYLRSHRQAYGKDLSALAAHLRHILHTAFPAGPIPSRPVTQL